MHVPTPSTDSLRRLSDSLGLALRDDELPGVQRAVDTALASYSRLDDLAERGRLAHGRGTGSRPIPQDNPYGAWLWQEKVAPTSSGVLDRRSIVMKDNVSVAGLPMSNGSRVLEGYAPETDATVVTRVLAAGATLLGTAACEDLCFSGNSFTSASGPVRNPYDASRSSGGSSSGCAVLVALGEADLAIGADQGGSVRGPAAWSGITGLKPTYGLVPYTGMFAIEMTVDHAGPMARTAAEVARLLDAVAGPDGHDPRQNGVARPSAGAYLDTLGADVSGTRVALVTEGFGWPGLSEDAVDVPVREAVRSLERLGCSVTEISVPWHREAVHVFAPIMSEGSTALVFRGNAMGTNWRGLYDPHLLRAFRDGRHARGHEMSLSAKVNFLVGSYAAELTGGYYYALAQNLVPSLRAAYDAVFAHFDVVAMPTLPMSPRVLPSGDLPADVFVAQALDMSCNNCAFNLTGDPAVSIPCDLVDGLPVGLMLAAASGRDAQLLAFADALQRDLLPVPQPPAAAPAGAAQPLGR